ncbi:MAG: glucose-1-phosphate thymidylyltransferase [Candidatus Dojkabacteria bacterium]|jgi:glucose-1-phosphate thymidylyltransferase
MKALILAGGRGTRLRPLTHTKNKHMLPIGNKPMIERIILDAIDLGIKDIIININKGDKEMPELLGDGKRFGKNITIQYIEQPEPNGMMYPIKLAEKLIGKEDFLFSAGDNILTGGLKEHYKDFKKKGSDAHVLVVRRPDYQNFGVAVMEGDKIIKTVEKPQEYVSDLVLSAIYFFTPAVFKAFDHIKPIDPKKSGKPEYYPPVVNNWLIDNGYTMTASEVTGWWKDTGAPEDIILANRLILEKECLNKDEGKVVDSKIEGNVEIMKGSKIKNSVIRGPVSIAKNCTLENAYIGPFTSIGEGSTVRNAQIENSILMGNCNIHDLETIIDSSLIGWNAEVTQKNGYPKADTLYIGDDSVVQLSK